MSSIVCGKRSIFEDAQCLPTPKRIRRRSFSSSPNPSTSTLVIEHSLEHGNPDLVLDSPLENKKFSTTPRDGSEWVELLVNKMINASSIDDARCRATNVLESLEKSIGESSNNNNVEATKDIHKENMMLKEKNELLRRDNTILKRAVSIQHERQKEYEDKNQEAQHLKQMISQYQERMRTLEVNNYALTMHLQQAQQANSIPGRFNPNIF